MSREKVLIKNVTIVDIGNKRYLNRDILLSNENGGSVIEKIAPRINIDNARRIDGSGKYAFPSFCDLWGSVYDMGGAFSEDFSTGSNAAVWGGYGFVLNRPFGNEIVGSPASLQRLKKRSKHDARCDVGFISALSVGCKGRELCDLNAMVDAGALAFSDGKDENLTDEALRSAMISVKSLDSMIIVTPQLKACYRDRSVNLGRMSRLLGHSGIPSSAEAISLSRYLILAQETGARVHVAGVSTAQSVELIFKAKKSGADVTASAFPANFCFTDNDIPFYGTGAKVWPPLRTKEDVDAVVKGLSDGTIDCVASDHTPLSDAKKKTSMQQAAFGSTGLQTAFSAACSYLHYPKYIDTFRLAEMFSAAPFRVLRIDAPKIAEGERASFVVVDLDRDFIVTKNFSRSKSNNCIFNALTLRATVEEAFISASQSDQ